MSKITAGLALLGVSLSAACAGTAADDEEVPQEEAPQEATGEALLPIGGINGFDGNNMKDATLFNNCNYSNTLVNRALTTANLNSRATYSTRDVICGGETASRNVFDHVVRCALSDGDVVDVNCSSGKRRYYGQFGLAKRWKTGACNSECQQKVTACVIAHSHKTNYEEDHVQFNMVSADMRGSREFPRVEGLYFGNLFKRCGVSQSILGCKAGTGDLITRVCDGTESCSVMTAPMNNDLGWCGADHGCDSRHGSGNEHPWDTWHKGCTVGGVTYNHPITVYRRSETPDNYMAVFYTRSTNRDGIAVRDWNRGHWTATCKNTEIMTGISVKPNHDAAHMALCETNSATSASDSVVLRVPGTSWRAIRAGDWARGHWKLECPRGKRVSGVSQDDTVPRSKFDAIRCSGTDSTYDYAKRCETRVLDGDGNDRGDTSAGDWDHGYKKAECSAGKTIVGVSVNPRSRRLSKILCCEP